MPVRFRSNYLIIVIATGGVVLFSVILNKTLLPRKNALYYIPSAKYIKFISGTFYSLVAHLLFIKAVLDYPEEIPHKTHYIISLCRIVVSLDHNIEEAFFFGGVVVPETSKEIKEGIYFLKEGLKVFPSDWRIPFWIGFNYLQLGNYSRAIELYKYASSLPESPPFLKSNLPFLYYRAGSVEEGAIYLNSLLCSIDNKHLKKIIKKKIQWLKDLSFLKKKVEDYYILYHSWPSSLDELVKKNLLDKIPEDTFGRGFYLDYGKGEPPLVKSRF